MPCFPSQLGTDDFRALKHQVASSLSTFTLGTPTVSCGAAALTSSPVGLPPVRSGQQAACPGRILAPGASSPPLTRPDACSALSAQGWRLHPPWKRSTKPRARMHAGRTVRGLAQLERASSLFCVPLLPGPDLPRQLGLQALF